MIPPAVRIWTVKCLHQDTLSFPSNAIQRFFPGHPDSNLIVASKRVFALTRVLIPFFHIWNQCRHLCDLLSLFTFIRII